jgi:hypothetical protein
MDIEKYIVIANNMSIKFRLIESDLKDCYKIMKKPYTSTAMKLMCC